jgi:hypothetical protein
MLGVAECWLHAENDNGRVSVNTLYDKLRKFSLARYQVGYILYLRHKKFSKVCGADCY